MGGDRPVVTTSIANVLDRYGEQFMSMFDDGGETHDVTMRSKKKQHSSQDDVGGVSKSAKETEEPGVAVKQITRPRDELDSIFTRKTNSGIRTTVSAPECKKTVAHETKHGQHGWEADVNAERLKRRMERKRFMASKSEKILSASSTASLGISRRDDQVMSASKARKVEREQLQAMAKEIQSFGATGLGKKAKAAFEQDRLLELGAKKQKGVRISARIGHGMAKKSAQREERALEESIASGMVSRKSLASKKRRDLKKMGVDRGLNEDMGTFKNGVLRVPKRQ